MAKTAKLCRDRRPRLRVGEVGSVFCVGFGLTNGRPGSNGAPDYESRGLEFESLLARQCNQRLTSISQFSADLLIPTGAHSWAHMMSVWRRPRAHPASGAFDLSAVAAPPALTSFADLAFSLPRFPRCLKLFSAL
jgi:hypothetical protein